MEIKQALRLNRDLFHKTQQEVAETLNTTQQQYWKYENGIQEIPLRHIIKLADYYNITLDQMTGRENTTINLSAEEKEIMIKYKALPDIDKGRIIQLLEELYNKSLCE